jgi:hypothetical protein
VAHEDVWLPWSEGAADAVTVDPENVVAESDEENNRYVIPATPVLASLSHVRAGPMTTQPLPCTETPAPTPPPMLIHIPRAETGG